MTRSLLSPSLGHSAPSVVRAPAPISHVRADHLTGVLVSLSIIAGAAWLGERVKGGSSKAPVAREPVAQFLVMPWIEPDKPEAEEPDVAKPQTDLRPPMLADLPLPGRPDAFVQPFEPPPPGTFRNGGDILTIPMGPTGLNDSSKIFDLTQLDRQPVAISQTRPSYPFEMRRNGISGQVEVDFIVDAAGHVSSAFAASSSNREFESAAVSAISKWRFQAGRKGGRAVKTHMQVPVVFTLNDGS